MDGTDYPRITAPSQPRPVTLVGQASEIDADGKYFHITREILARGYRGGQVYYKVVWVGTDQNGKHWDDGWVHEDNVTDDLKAEYARDNPQTKKTSVVKINTDTKAADDLESLADSDLEDWHMEDMDEVASDDDADGETDPEYKSEVVITPVSKPRRSARLQNKNISGEDSDDDADYEIDPDYKPERLVTPSGN